MNVDASIRKKLQEKVVFHLTEAARYGELVKEFGGGPVKATRHRRTKEEIAAGVPAGKKPRTPAQKAAIAKALAVRKAKLQESKGAPLAVAAGE